MNFFWAILGHAMSAELDARATASASRPGKYEIYLALGALGMSLLELPQVGLSPPKNSIPGLSPRAPHYSSFITCAGLI
jgi:hypothetical protein